VRAVRRETDLIGASLSHYPVKRRLAPAAWVRCTPLALLRPVVSTKESATSLGLAPSGSFVLKEALLLLAWLGEALRRTRDADLLGFGDVSDAGREAVSFRAAGGG
jgi:hypothetical protein